MKAHAPTIILCYPADPAEWWFAQGDTRAIAERTYFAKSRAILTP